MISQLEWHKINSFLDLPKEHGYYLVNVYTKSEQDYIEGLNEKDRETYCHGEDPSDIWNAIKYAYYNPASKLWECNHFTYNALIDYVDPLEEDLVTHWAKLPNTPNVVLKDQPKHSFLGVKWGLPES